MKIDELKHSIIRLYKKTISKYIKRLIESFSSDSERLYIVKLVFVLFTILLGFQTSRDSGQFWISIIEMSLIVLITNLVGSYRRKIAYWLNSLLFLLLILEQFFLFFAGSYLSMIMITNVDSLQALSGKMPVYISCLIPIIIISFFPIHILKYKFSVQVCAILGLLAIEVNFFNFEVVVTSPYYNFGELWQQRQEQLRIIQEIKNSKNLTSEFYKSGITDYQKKPSQLPKAPNVILIFVEGLSQHIIDDPRNIMPNVATYQKKSLEFENYYNHTFATYRGLSGQLYSGYQFDNYDSNSLVSLQSILRESGYHTSFINSEPENITFTHYLASFKYDKVITQQKGRSGYANTMSDKDSFEFLFKQVEERSKTGKPFFLTLYTFGTHASFDSQNKKFGKGDDPMLNKFFDFDYQFGQFMDKLENVDFGDDTIVVFTTDHATYVDNNYLKTFGDFPRGHGSLDKVPFFIYNRQLQSKTIDVKGRNSLDLTPTILDFLDLSSENYFLGTSLFAQDSELIFSNIYNSELNYMSTETGHIDFLKLSEEKEIMEMVEQYFVAKQQLPQKPD